MKTRHFSIRRYLTVHILLWVLVMTSLPVIWVYLDAKHEVEELFDASLAQSARVLHGLVNRESVATNLHHLTRSLQTKDSGLKHFTQQEAEEDGHTYEKKVAFQVWNPDGKLLIKSASAPPIPLASLQKGYSNKIIDDYEWRTFALYSTPDRWWLIVGERDDIRTEIAAYIIRGHVWPVLLVTPLLALIIWTLISNSLLPLQALARQMDNRDYQDLATLNEQQSPQETLGLVIAMNQLFQRLNHAYQRESRFSADAAHELRNPLASLMIHTENALEDNQSWLGNADSASHPPDHQQSLKLHFSQQHNDLSQIKQGIMRLSHLVQQLLALSRAETGLQVSKADCDAAVLCQEVFNQQKTSAEQKQQALELDNKEPCVLHANQVLITSLLHNLVSNAIHYTPELGTIRLSCKNSVSIRATAPSEACSGVVILQIDDSGPGIAEAERERVKDRFYRVPGNAHYGVGLGLSIAQAIIERHAGQWQFEPSDLGGLRVKVMLPIATDQ